MQFPTFPTLICAALSLLSLSAIGQTPAKPSPIDRATLAARLLATEGIGKPGELLAQPTYRASLFAHEVLRLTGEPALQTLSAADPEFDRFLAAFLTDADWMRAYLTSGRPIAKTPLGLEVLCSLWKAEGKSKDFGNYRELTAALANQWSVGPNAIPLQIKQSHPNFSARPLDRFRLYRDFDRKGRLHPMFRKLKSWELTYVVGQQWSDSALAWLNEHANLPLERYPDACWAVEYKGTSDFGDSVQGPLYMRAWSDQMNEAQNARLHGSVCGGLSTYGVCAAAAHGIPAYTVGQPGHCAMAVRFSRGDWRGGFGGPDGGTHLNVWPGNIHYIDLAETVFGDDAGLESALLHLARAHLFRDSGRDSSADESLAAAVKASPLHLDIRREEIARMKERSLTPAQWMSYAESLFTDFGTHTHPAIDLCSVIEPMILAGADDATRLAWFSKVQRAAARATESWAWDVAAQVLAPQAKQLQSDSSRESLFRDALSAHIGGKGESFGKILEWGVKELVEKGQGDAFGRAFTAAVAASSDAKPDPKQMQGAYAKSILAAEVARSITAFQALSQSAKPFAPPPPPPLQLNMPTGAIVSNKGIISASSSSWDQPLSHLGVLGETGGLIHTKDETTPTIIVELPAATTHLGGVLLVKNDDNQQRLKRVKLSRSTDGATWFPLAESEDMPRQWRIDAPPGTAARWLKFEALNDKPEVCHLRNFIVTTL